MSVHITRTGKNEVRWRDAEGRNRSKTFDDKDEAIAFDKAMADVHRAGRTVTAIRQSLDQLADAGHVERLGDGTYRFGVEQ